ncbi:MAG TPA: glycosidase [Patescibacteria group bacterium]|nr:glycosidase [Patescibacteria group bacterium]
MSLMETQVRLGEFEGVVSLNNPVLRYPDNPILTCHDVNEVWGDNPLWQTYTVHNAGMAQILTAEGDPQTLMLFRSHLADGRSGIGKAVSDIGLTGWRIDSKPFLLPAKDSDNFARGLDSRATEAIIEAEGGGVEDLRINPVGNGQFVLTYSAYHETKPNRVKVMIATTSDFETIERHGPISTEDMRNVVIFPEPDKNGQWSALLRPNDKALEEAGASHTGGAFEEIRIGRAPSPTGPWTIGEVIMRSGHGPSAAQSKIGPCAPPLWTPQGWLSIIHGVRGTMDGNPYTLGVAFHDLDNPAKVHLSAAPILMPSQSDCRVRETDYVHVPNVVFSCGALILGDGETVAIYYGGNDTEMNVGLSNVGVLREMCNTFAQDPLTGKHLYSLN